MRWAHDKSADDDGKPVDDVIVSVSLHSKLHECVGRYTVREMNGSTLDPGAINN